MDSFIIFLEKYFIYLYPGFITYYIDRFISARSTKFTKESAMIFIAISYIYVIVYKSVVELFTKENVQDITAVSSLIIMIISIVVPVVFNFFKKKYSKGLDRVLTFLKIDTSLEETVFDHLYKMCDSFGQDVNMYITFYTNGGEYMYEGFLRNYESDPEREGVICLNKYRVYDTKSEKFKLINDYTECREKYLYVKMKDISVMEIEYR